MTIKIGDVITHTSHLGIVGIYIGKVNGLLQVRTIDTSTHKSYVYEEKDQLEYFWRHF